MLQLLENLFGSASDREIKKMAPLLDEMRRLEPVCVAMSNWELRAQTGKLKQRLAAGEGLDEILPEAFATVREAAKRVIGLRHFDVQLIGGIVLHRGGISEMVTGEGKTLVATLPSYLNALTGDGVHVVTVNDYLARRDREWMGPIYEFLGLTVGLIQHEMNPWERKVAYRADITFGTNNEFGFDYLRDNMARHPDFVSQRPLNYAVIDEIDSILVDEARTPLIISGRPEKSTDLYYRVNEAVKGLRRDEHFEMDEKNKHIFLNEDGMGKVEKAMGVENLYANDQFGIVHMVNQSLKAHNFFRKDDEYVVRDGMVHIVDEFTGRILEGRRFSDGLHQAIEAKEGVAIQSETQTIASITYQNYFMLYNKICGMTGTAMTEAAEFSQIYSLDVVAIPTNLPMQRQDFSDLVFATEKGKFNRVVDEIVAIHESGRPVLVGTTSIEKSELVAKNLSQRGVEGYQVLNAKYHEREAAIVSNAGKRGAITIATNMAGRGTDIKLGEGVRELGGLAIIGTERHESRRIDNQLRGRAGRQGDPGTTRFFLSLEDDVARLFGGERVKRIVNLMGGSEAMDEEPLEQKMVSRSVQRAQAAVESMNFETRKHLKDYDDVMNRQRLVVYEMRREVLEDEDVSERVSGMIESIVQRYVDQYAPQDELPDEWDLEELARMMSLMFGFEVRTFAEDGTDAKELVDDLIDQVIDNYKERIAHHAEEIRADFKEQTGREDSGIDFQKLARRRFRDFEKMALLRTVDEKWIDHLYTMDYLKESVRLRAYGQKDPLVEFKREGFETFQMMMNAVEDDVIQTLFRITHPDTWRRTRELEKRGELTRETNPFAGIAEYQYVSASKEVDRSFASYDTSRFALGGQAAAAQTQPRAGAGARAAVASRDDGGGEEEEGRTRPAGGNRKQRRRQELAAKREAKKTKKRGKS